MKRKTTPPIVIAILLAATLLGKYFNTDSPGVQTAAPGGAAPATVSHNASSRTPERAGGPRLAGEFRIADVTVTDNNSGRKIHLDHVDLRPVLDRIAAGEKDSHRNDGTVYRNASRALPRHPQGYYREYVIRTPGLSGPGPQRLILGEGGEIYYTHDHYDTFITVKGGT